MVRVEPDEEKGPIVYMGAEFYPPAEPERAPEPHVEEEEEDEKQPIVEGQPSLLEPNPPPVKPKPVRRARKPAARAIAPTGRAVGAEGRARNVRQSITDQCSRTSPFYGEFREYLAACGWLESKEYEEWSRIPSIPRIPCIPLLSARPGVLARDVTERHHREKHRQHFAVAEIVLGEALGQHRKDHRDGSVQNESCIWIGEFSAQSPREVPQDFRDQPKKYQQRRKAALGCILQIDIVQVPVIADR